MLLSQTHGKYWSLTSSPASSIFPASLEGFEPTTSAFGGQRSVHLSYSDITR